MRLKFENPMCAWASWATRRRDLARRHGATHVEGRLIELGGARHPILTLVQSLALGLTLVACSRIALDHPVGPVVVFTGAAPLPTNHPVIGLISAVGGPARVRVDWHAQAPALELPHFAVFVGPDPQMLFANTPAIEDPEGTMTVLEGLPNETVLFVAIGIRAGLKDNYLPSGPALSVRTGEPVYVDPGAAAGGDGMAPDTAIDDLQLGIATAISLSRGNVWVKGGLIENASITQFGGVYLSGGFDPGMRLRYRDPILYPTRITGSVNHSIFNIDAGDGTCVIDGFDLDGVGTATNGVRDEAGFALEVRSLNITGCFRGIKLRSPQFQSIIPVVIAGVHVRDSRAEGVDVDGPYDIAIESSVFEQNTFEGVRIKYLVAPENGTATARVRGCDFQRNGRDGFECRMIQPAAAGHTGGQFTILVQDSDFEQNADRGMVLNLDYDLFPEWTSDIQVSGCRFRGNVNAGVDLHLDSTSTALVERISSSANGAEGVKVKGGTLPVMATISASALFGNLGAGVSVSEGTCSVVLSHCVLSGNFAGGLISLPEPSSAVSCLIWVQPQAWSNATPHATPTQTLADPEPCLRSAREYERIVAIDGTSVTLDATPLNSSIGSVELADDSAPRRVSSAAANVLVLDPAPTPIILPGVLGFFTDSESVTEDFRLSKASIGLGAGMATPLGPLVDAGIFSSPHGGLPGRNDAVPPANFFVGTTSPPWAIAMASDAVVVVNFVGGSPDPASIPNTVFAVDPQGNSLAITAFVERGLLKVLPPARGWSTGTVLELHKGMQSISGTRLSAPLALPLTIQ